MTAGHCEPRSGETLPPNWRQRMRPPIVNRLDPLSRYTGNTTDILNVRTASRIVAGGLSGLVAGLVFASAHALLIVPIWDRIAFGLLSAVLAGCAAGWAFAEFDIESTPLAGLGFGLILWLGVVPVTLVDSVLRLTGVAHRYELLAVAVAVGLAIAAGVLLGARFGKTPRAKAAGAAATLLLTIAMGGPVPLPNGRRAIAIFLAVLPASAIAGLLLGALARRFPRQTISR